MPLCETRSTNDSQGDFPEGFQQAFRRRQARATFGIASEQTSQFHLLLTQTLPKRPFQQSHDTQGDGEQANHIRPDGHRVAHTKEPGTRDGL